MTERLAHFGMIVALGHDQLDRLAGCLERRGKIARLALELRRFERAAGEHQRGVDLVEMTLGRERLLHLVGEFHVAAALREPHRL